MSGIDHVRMKINIKLTINLIFNEIHLAAKILTKLNKKLGALRVKPNTKAGSLFG